MPPPIPGAHPMTPLRSLARLCSMNPSAHLVGLLPGSLALAALLTAATPALAAPGGGAQRGQRQGGGQQGAQGQAPARSVWDDAEAVERGGAMLATLLEAAGGLEAWKGLGGLRLDVLEARHVVVDHANDRWAVHHYIPRLCHFTPEGNGFLWSEFVGPQMKGPAYRRQIAVDGVYWAEMGGQYTRAEGIADSVRGIFERHLLLGAMPFSIQVLGGRLAFVRETTREAGDGERPTEVYSLRLPKGQAIAMEEGEKAREFLVLVDTESKRVVQLQYIVDRRMPGREVKGIVRCYVDFGGTLEVGDVKLPRRYDLWRENPSYMLRWISADPRAEEVPPAALRKPWLTNSIYVPTARADHWDPPGGVPEPEGRGARPAPRVGPPEARGDGDGDASGESDAGGSGEESGQGR